MEPIAPKAESPQEEPRPWVATLLAVIAAFLEVMYRQKKVIQALRDEIARLKKQKTKPSIGPSKLTQGDGKKRGVRKKKGEDRPRRPADRTVIVKAEGVPEGSRFKGYNDYRIQDLVIRAETTLYRIEKWITPEGTCVTGKLPVPLPEGPGDHFGPTLRCFILHQYYHAQVTEPLLAEELREWGVQISSGELHALITKGKEPFHREKDEILRVGLRVSSHVHVDDSGARHQGKNGYVTHIGNEWFAWFASTASKSRINFLELLRSGHTDYVLNDDALTYMVDQKLPPSIVERLTAEASAAGDNRVFADADAWQAALTRWSLTEERHIRIVTEGVLIGAILTHDLNPKLAILSDDAGQFNVLIHGLCWVHAERVLAKLMGFNDEQRAALEQVRTAVWALYRDLKAYKTAPSLEAKSALTQRFDALCATKTCFASLNQALKRMARNKKELLLVLDRPDIPLHNNLSEGDIREYVKRRKISGGTRSDEGRRGRDTFASLKKTCRKLGLSFWNYLKDRLCGDNLIPPLPKLIEARAQSP